MERARFVPHRAVVESGPYVALVFPYIWMVMVLVADLHIDRQLGNLP
jgi:hypothetical protein